jgi:hypothetical protein
VDADGDGFNCIFDCDDSSNQASPDGTEVGCDGLDNDCDTQTSDIRDEDGDGFTCDVDCNETDTAINPGAAEKCNDAIDNDCDGLIDNDPGFEDPECACPDGDSDGYADALMGPDCTDCDDTNAAINPGVAEVCDDGIDNDCDVGTIDQLDADGDGFDCLADCNDGDPFIRPNAVEICGDGIDNNCNGMADDIADVDADTHTCDVDCNDNEAEIFPGATEVCNDGIDNDCDPVTLDLFDGDMDTFLCDVDCADDDDTVNPGVAEVCNDAIDNDCDPGTLDLFDVDQDGSTCDVDCNDGDPAINPLIPEHCSDLVDNNCDTLTDDEDTIACDTGCPDVDTDGYWCEDCNDGDAAINPAAVEICGDLADNDCDIATPDLEDVDGDGSTCDVDCDDGDFDVNPLAAEITCDGIDNNCNGPADDVVDIDVDTYGCDVDCNDGDPQVNPGIPEASCDAIDNDCNVATSDLSDIDGDSFTCADTNVRGAISVRAAGASSFTIVNNTLVNNSVPLGTGAGVWIDDMSSTLTSVVANNIFIDNSALLGGGLNLTTFYGLLRNNDFYNNAGGDMYDAGGSGVVKAGNLFVDPQFSAPLSGNYRLGETSPLIDAADPVNAPSNDLDRVPRPFDGDNDLTAIADVGAYEYPSGEVTGLLFTDRDIMTWDVPPTADAFNLYRGSLANLRTFGIYTQNPASPLADQFCDVLPGEVPFTDTFEPGALEAVFYLVTQTGLAFEGILGVDSTGLVRPITRPCP